MEKAGRYSAADFLSFGEPFGSPIPQRPQPLDYSLRVAAIIRYKQPARNLFRNLLREKNLPPDPFSINFPRVFMETINRSS
jgi:hypothetical protein